MTSPTVSLHVRVPPATKERAERRADLEGITTTEYVIRALDRAELVDELVAAATEALQWSRGRRGSDELADVLERIAEASS